MQFVLGLFVGTFVGMMVMGLCRCMALSCRNFSCPTSPEVEEDHSGALGKAVVNF